MTRENLATLRNLVDYLEDRDLGMKRDMSLFESVFQNFPVPAAIWMADSEGHCMSRRVTDSKSNDSKERDVCVETIMNHFSKSDFKGVLWDKISAALKGETVSFLMTTRSSEKVTCIWTNLIPHFSGPDVLGVIGISLDVSSSFEMLDALMKVKSTESLSETSQNLVSHAINSCYLKSLIEKSNG